MMGEVVNIGDTLSADDPLAPTPEELRFVAASKAKAHKHERRLVAVPFAFMADVRGKTTGCETLIVAMLIYRRTYVCSRRTVTLPGAELAELGINREAKRRALTQLIRAGFIRAKRNEWGKSIPITLIWRESGLQLLSPLGRESQ
jgi:hypothetical protein